MIRQIFRWCGWILLLIGINAFAEQNSPLSMDQAFPLKIWSPDPQTVVIQWDIQPGYYLYKDRIHIAPAPDSTVELGAPRFPQATEHYNPILGHFSAYEGLLQLGVPVLSATSTSIVLQIQYQGCAQKGYCYPPQTRLIEVNLSAQPEAIASDSIPTQKTPVTMNKGWGWGSWLGFLGMGLLISLTPCVLPMIPVLSGLILGKEHIGHWRAFFISLAYVLGMAVTYAMAGLLFGALGGSLQVYLQKTWIIALFSGVFVLMALSLFGVFQIEPPEKLRAYLAGLSNRQAQGSLFGAAVMGCLSSLILSPCATPPLVAVLSYISQSGNAYLGGLALFVIGLGSGIPLLLIGAFGKRLLPKAGAWMGVIENILGVILLGMGIWMLSRILPDRIVLMLWAFLAIGLAIALEAFNTVTTRFKLICKSLGILVFVYGILLLVGAMEGARTPWESLVFKKSADSAQNSIDFLSVSSLDDVQKAMNQAPGKPVILDFYADWCVSCKIIDRNVFADSAVKNKLAGYLLLRSDVTVGTQENQALMKEYRVVAPPTLLFFDQNHQELTDARIIGEISSADFIKRLNQLAEQK